MQTKLYNKLLSIYYKQGQSGVFHYANRHPRQFEKAHKWCGQCETDTPRIKKRKSCAVCG
jgi:hypothetical protein